jgi:hypothetical protein
VGLCESGNESFGSVKCGEMPEEVMNYWFLKKGSALWSP